MPVVNDAFLSFKDVSLSYGRNQAVFDFDLSISGGVTFGLIGLNGAGKTTLIKALLGLKDVGRGEILIGGRNCSEPESHKILAYLPERFDPPWFLKGDEFVRFSMNLYGTAFDRQAMIDLAVRLKLDPGVLGNRMSTYSKGMRQKTGLMATVLTGCNLLILDEPMSGLDPLARTAVKDVLLQLRKEGRTVFFSSHILSDMDEICDHVAIMHQGRKVFDGTPDSLKKQGGNENIERAFLSLIGADHITSQAA